MSDLSDFLLARIAEDEAAARAATIDAWGHEVGSRDGFGWASLALSSERDTTPGQDEHITRHDPARARALAECDAKRRIVAEHGTCADPCDHAYDTSLMGWMCLTLRGLATVYADHPDYRDQWKP